MSLCVSHFLILPLVVINPSRPPAEAVSRTFFFERFIPRPSTYGIRGLASWSHSASPLGLLANSSRSTAVRPPLLEERSSQQEHHHGAPLLIAFIVCHQASCMVGISYFAFTSSERSRPLLSTDKNKPAKSHETLPTSSRDVSIHLTPPLDLLRLFLEPQRS